MSSMGLRFARSVCLCLCLCFMNFSMGNIARADRLELVSRGLQEQVSDTAGGASSLPTSGANQRSLVSADGRWSVFVSSAPNLTSGQVDTNSTTDVFLYDRVNDAVTLVSHANGAFGTAANGASLAPSISADGRWIAFGSEATNLSPGQTDTNAARDVFLYDRDTGGITLVSRTGASATTTGSSLSTDALISTDGSAVVYVSRAPNLMAGQSDLNTADDVFLWSRATGTNVLVSHIASSATGAQFGTASNEPVISADGNWVAFSSTATSLVSGVTDSNLSTDVFLWNRTANTNQLASHTSASALTAGNSSAANPRLSADASTVLFRGNANNYVAGFVDGNTGSDLYLFSRDTGAITLVNHAATSLTTSGNRPADEAALSADGSWVALASNATNHVVGQVDGSTSTTDVFLFNRADGTLSLVSRRAGTTTTAANDSGFSPWNVQVSDDGSFVGFQSAGTDLISGQSDPNGGHDLFVFDRLAQTVTLLSGTAASATSAGNGVVQTVGMSGDGRWFLFASVGTNLVAGIGDLNGAADVFLADRVDRTTALVSQRDADLPSLSANGDSAVLNVVPPLVPTPAVSGDGRYTVFQSTGRNLVPGQVDNNGNLDVFLYDLSTGAVVLVSRANGATETTGNAASRAPVISTDGRWVAFVSSATNLIAGQSDTSAADDVFLWDRLTGTMTLVSRSRLGAVIAVGGTTPVLSADGTWLAFLSSANNLASGVSDSNGTADVFLYNRTTAAMSLVSHSSFGLTSAAGAASEPLISADGSYVGFLTTSNSVISGQSDTVGTPDLFLWERATGTLTLVSHPYTASTTALGASAPAMSADGNWLAFSTTATGVVPSFTDSNGVADIYIWQRAFNVNFLVSRAGLNTGNQAAQGAALSADGRYVAYLSRASNHINGGTDTNSSADVILFDRTILTNRLVSHIPASTVTAANGIAKTVAISADGSRVSFLSTATNLVTGQTDATGTYDLFVFDNATSQVRLASHRLASETTAPTAGSDGGFLSSNGKVTVFQSIDSGLVSSDFNNRQDVFLWTDESGTDLAIAKTDGVASAVPGQVVTYMITATNSGPMATGATVTDSFPAALQGISWTCTAGGGATCAASGAGALAQSVNLPVNGTVTFTVMGTVAANATGTLANTASIAPTGGVPDLNAANNSSTDIDTLAPQADLSISLADSPDPVGRGATLTYLISVSNAGPSAAASVSVVDTLPAGATFAGASGDGWACGQAGDVVTCTRPSLAPGSAPALFIQVIAPVSRGIATLTNAVAVTAATADPVANNAASTTTAVYQPGITVAPVSGLTTTEAGGTATFTVVLDTPPVADVTIALASGDTAEGTVSPASLTFTTSDWSTPRTVTVTGVNDDYDDGNVDFTIVTSPAASADVGYAGIDPADVAVANEDDDATGIEVTPAAGLTTTEAGGTATFTVVLKARPRADVTIALASSDTAEGTAEPASLTFTTDTWNTPQTVTVTGVNDDYDDGNVAFIITTSPAASTDTGYAGIDPADVSVSNTDDDAAGIVVTPTSGLTTTEAGGTAAFTIVLTSRPRADVTIGLSSSDTAEGTVAPASLTFTTADWSTPQTVTVTGVDDAYDDGNAPFTITTGAASSTDAGYAGIDPADVSVSNIDDDAAGIVVSPTSGLTTTEAGGTAAFTVALASRPRADVTIALASSDTAEGTVDPASLTFTTGDWSTPKTVTVTGVNDDYDDGNVAYTITTGAAASTDTGFAGIDPADVAVSNEDDDTSAIEVSPTSGLITTEAGGTATFTVTLRGRPAADVTIALESSDPGEGQPSPATLTFTTDDWSTPKTVTVTGQDDHLRDGDAAYTIVLHPARSGDSAFNGIDPADVTATNRDDNYEGVFYTVPPCRLYDSRQPGNGPALQNNQVTIVQALGACRIPPTARVVAMNLSFSGAGPAGQVLVYPGDLAQPPLPEQLWIRAGAFSRSLSSIMPLGANGTLAILPRLKAPKLNPTVQITLDVSGYFE